MSLNYTLTTAQVWYLEMKTAPVFTSAQLQEVKIVPLQKPLSVDAYRKYYFGVGEQWNWLDRMVMEDEKLYALINAENTDIFVLHVNGEEAGYTELVSGDGATELQYFGLFPSAVGKGYGKFFLQWSITKAWSYPGTKKVRVNTCSLDHPRALALYQHCGFMLVEEKNETRKVRMR